MFEVPRVVLVVLVLVPWWLLLRENLAVLVVYFPVLELGLYYLALDLVSSRVVVVGLVRHHILLVKKWVVRDTLCQ